MDGLTRNLRDWNHLGLEDSEVCPNFPRIPFNKENSILDFCVHFFEILFHGQYLTAKNLKKINSFFT